MTRLYILLYFSLGFLSVSAQKKEEVNQMVLLPTSLKIDGNTSEWGSQLSAIDKATQLSYKVSNDARNFYIVIRGNTPAVTQKIMAGGITVSLNTKGEKTIKSAVSITYPWITILDNKAASQNVRNLSVMPEGKNSDQAITYRDSIMMEYNRKRINTFKLIGISNIQGVIDSLISIYNKYGIRVGASINKDQLYSYELCIPLSLFTKNEQVDITYNIRLNGEKYVARKIPTMGERETAVGGSQVGPVMVARGVGVIAPGQLTGKMAEILDRVTPTDFWGVYRITKQP